MKNCKLAILAIMALSACCQLTETDQWKGPVVVGFSTGYSSKVSADAAAGRLEWEEGDNIVLWALNTAGEETVGSQPFHYLAGRQDLSQDLPSKAGIFGRISMARTGSPLISDSLTRQSRTVGDL